MRIVRQEGDETLVVIDQSVLKWVPTAEAVDDEEYVPPSEEVIRRLEEAEQPLPWPDQAV